MTEPVQISLIPHQYMIRIIADKNVYCCPRIRILLKIYLDIYVIGFPHFPDDITITISSKLILRLSTKRIFIHFHHISADAPVRVR